MTALRTDNSSLNMEGVHASILLMLLYMNTASAAPFTHTANDLAISYPNLQSFGNNSLNSNVSLSTPFNLSASFPHPIPGTDLTLFFSPSHDKPIPVEDISPCIRQTSIRMIRFIQDFGNGPLEREDDPYISPPMSEVSCRLEIRSWPRASPPGERVTFLTYHDVCDVLFDLQQWMLPAIWIPGLLVESLSFVIGHARYGSIGEGRIWGT